MKAFLNGYRMSMEHKSGERFAIAVQAGEIAASVEVSLLAKLVMTVHQGMTLKAVHGESEGACVDSQQDEPVIDARLHADPNND